MTLRQRAPLFAGFWLVVFLSLGNAWLAAFASSPAAGLDEPKQLIITILDGEGTLNNIRQRDAREPVVQVTDENHKPVSGVALLFLIHGGGSGATETFDGGLTYSTTTNAEGIGHTSGLVPGPHPGSVTITVTATLGALVVTAIIHQTNVITPLQPGESAPPSVSSGIRHNLLHPGRPTLITAGAVAAAGVILGVTLAERGNGATSLSLGNSTVNAP